MKATASKQTRAGFVALAGAPNVGKSTLLNALVGFKLSITAPKPQTTRNRILGVKVHGATQMAFLDIPGIHRATGSLGRRMVDRARSCVEEADVVCWLVAADRGLSRADRSELQGLRARKLLMVISKCDLVPKPAVLPIMAELGELLPNTESVPVSALRREGLTDLLDTLSASLPEGPWWYPADVVTDSPEHFLAAELVREQLFRRLRQEMPYRLAVIVDSFRSQRERVRIEATIYTDSASSKRIVVGRGGEVLKEAGIAARTGCERLLRRRVDLFLTVKVRKAWQEDAEFLARLGI